MASSSAGGRNDEAERRCQQYFDEIMMSPAEYSSTENLGETSLQADLLKLLMRVHDVRPVKISEYQFGLSTRLIRNSRLIVYEKDDRTKVREYSALKTKDQFCLQCRSASHHKCLIYCKFICGVLFAPVNHLCVTRIADAVMEVQEKLKNGDVRGAARLQRNTTEKFPNFSKSDPIKLSPPQTVYYTTDDDDDGDELDSANPGDPGSSEQITVSVSTERLCDELMSILDMPSSSTINSDPAKSGDNRQTLSSRKRSARTELNRDVKKKRIELGVTVGALRRTGLKLKPLPPRPSRSLEALNGEPNSRCAGKDAAEKENSCGL